MKGKMSDDDIETILKRGEEKTKEEDEKIDRKLKE